MRKFMLIVVLVFSFVGCGGGGDLDTDVSSEGLVVKSAVSVEGVAVFTDEATGEDVRVFSEDKDGSPLSGIKVDFWDSEGSEVFIAVDPDGVYLPAFEIFPHNSDHLITMSIIGDDDWDQVEEVPFDSEKGDAIKNLWDDPDINVVYHGRFTPEEIDRVDGLRLAILGHTLGKVYRYFSRFIDFSEIINKIFGVEYQEPEFYDMYTLLPKSGVTTAIYWLEPVEEICGDGIDNDGDGEVDEGCVPNTPTDLVVTVIDVNNYYNSYYDLKIEWKHDSDNAWFLVTLVDPAEYSGGFYIYEMTATLHYVDERNSWGVWVRAHNEFGESDWVHTSGVFPTN